MCKTRLFHYIKGINGLIMHYLLSFEKPIRTNKSLGKIMPRDLNSFLLVKFTRIENNFLNSFKMIYFYF